MAAKRATAVALAPIQKVRVNARAKVRAKARAVLVQNIANPSLKAQSAKLGFLLFYPMAGLGKIES